MGETAVNESKVMNQFLTAYCSREREIKYFLNDLVPLNSASFLIFWVKNCQ